MKRYFYPPGLETNMIHFLEVSFSSVIAFQDIAKVLSSAYLLSFLKVQDHFCVPFHSCHFAGIFLFLPTADHFPVQPLPRNWASLFLSPTGCQGQCLRQQWSKGKEGDMTWPLGGPPFLSSTPSFWNPRKGLQTRLYHLLDV